MTPSPQIAETVLPLLCEVKTVRPKVADTLFVLKYHMGIMAFPSKKGEHMSSEKRKEPLKDVESCSYPPEN